MWTRILTVAILGLVGSAASAQDRLSIPSLGSTDPREASSLSAECSRDRGGAWLICDFTQTGVRPQTRPADVAARVEVASKGLREATPEDLARAQRSWCDLRERERETANASDVPAAARAYADRLLVLLDRICDRPTPENVTEFLRFVIEKETVTCRVWTHSFRETFVQQPGGTWLSQSGPSGPFGLVVVSTLAPEDREARVPVLWTYRSQKIVTDRRTPTGAPADAGPLAFSWKAPAKALACEFIEFGPQE